MLNKIKIEFGNIVNYECDAIVNSANTWLLGGSGVCGAIFKAAGSAELQTVCDSIGGCETGNAVITPGFNLKSKYIIHAVGPRYNDDSDATLLESTYKSILRIADEYQMKSIAIPSISTGIYGYPLDKAVTIALNTLINNPVDCLESIYIVCFDIDTYSAYKDKMKLLKTSDNQIMKYFETLNNSNGKLDIFVNENKVIDLDEVGHILILGSTGSGKTVFLTNLLCSLLYKNSNDIELIIIDPKCVEHRDFIDVKCCHDGKVYNGITYRNEKLDLSETFEICDYLTKEYLRRKTLANDNLLNEKKIIVVWDEIADIYSMSEASTKTKFDDLLSTLMLEGKEVGIHLVISTQVPFFVKNAKIMNTCPCKIAFKLIDEEFAKEYIESNNILELKRPGEMVLSYKEICENLKCQKFDYEEILRFLENYK